MNRVTIVLLSLLVVSPVAGAPPEPATARSIKLPDVRTELREGAGKDKTAAHCGVCHSLDYITMQPAFSKKQWTGTVQKMVKIMGAPIPEQDANVIVDYLTSQYGKGD